MNARDTILARLRAALADEPAPAPIPRDYGVTLTDTDLIGLLTDRLIDYRARVHETLAAALSGVDRLLVPADLPPGWLASFVGTVVPDDGEAGTEVLDSVDAVLTGCAVAIAETGTIVLDAGPAQGRRAITLVPDRHIVVVRADQIVGRVPEAIRALAAGSTRRPLTWISGPSATSDIELVRIEGVHGPRRLDVVIGSAHIPGPVARSLLAPPVARLSRIPCDVPHAPAGTLTANSGTRSQKDWVAVARSRM